MANWFSKLTLAVLTGVLIYWLTQGLRTDAPSTQSSATRVVGYLVVSDGGQVRNLNDLGAGATLCGNKSTIEALRAFAPLVTFNLRTVPTQELFQAYQVGLCKGVLFRQLTQTNEVFPADLAGGRVIEIRS
ncbi:hypothetical protein GCM10016455_00500 [Aliiroseovarius zhejiangensis]|uniref:Lipoprotein n=1 Tax=Aliiroseovarius zhejiangensis TaxID=1632025 RepID=A0ABQ3II87_9RHOB|nr:hypothetical protein [Aliiroseovarius zhejiangensis]GHE85277.1 hypothetical protein GCM10016455_00500 [Aliiroseovarius zhejiangensis]